MSDFTNYTESEIVNWMVGGDAMPSPPSNIYVGLHTGDPTETGGSNEVSGNNYARASTTAGTDWTISANTFENADDILFNEASGSWGTVSHFSLWDSSTGGNALAYSALDSSRSVESGDAPVFRATNLSGTVD